MNDRPDTQIQAELQALEEFRRSYASQRPGQGALPSGSPPQGSSIDREDPDVRRLLEAMAFLSVRNRQAALQNLQATWHRVFAGCFDFLLRPMPAAGIARALVTARMTEAVELPRGTELMVTTEEGETAGLQTTADLRVLPITLDRTEIRLRPGGYRLILRFSSRYPRTDPPGLLRLYLYYLDDYLLALRAHYQIRAHLVRALAQYDAPIDEQTEGPSCPVSFGTAWDPPGPSSYQPDPRSPLQAVREFFHFPLQELFINVAVPPPSRPWTQLEIGLDLDGDWPRDPPLYREVFQLHAVPVTNTRRCYSQPILCDGTRDAYRINHISGQEGYVLCQALGVYEVTAEGLSPVPLAMLHNGERVYEIEHRTERHGLTGALGGRAAYLLIRSPESLRTPRQFVVDGTFYQPALTAQARGRLLLSVPDRALPGLDWQALGSLVPARDSRVGADADSLLRVLALRMRSTLSLPELAEILDLLGLVDSPLYREVFLLLTALSVRTTAEVSLQRIGLRDHYTLRLSAFEPVHEPLVWSLLRAVRAVLDAWNHESGIALSYDAGPCTLRLPLDPAASGRTR